MMLEVQHIVNPSVLAIKIALKHGNTFSCLQKIIHKIYILQITGHSNANIPVTPIGFSLLFSF